MISRMRALAAGAAVLVASIGVAHGTVYNFTKIAETAGPFSSVSNGAINDHGDVVFWSKLDGTNMSGFHYGNGTGTTLGDYTQIADLTTGSWTEFDTLPDINNSRQVVFKVGFGTPNYYQGIFIGVGGETQQGDYTEILNMNTDPSINPSSQLRINNAAQVSFTGTNGVYRADGASTIRVFGTGRPIGGYQDPGLNNNGVISGVGRIAGTQIDGVFAGSGGESAAADYAKIAADGDDVFSSFSSSGPSAINDDGLVVFRAEFPGSYDDSIVVGPPGASQLSDYRVVVTEDDNNLDFFGFPSFNNAGTVVFSAINRSEGQYHFGIFTGSDPVADKVLEVGDPLFGSVVDGVNTTVNALNESGSIAITARLQNGNNVIVRADPVPGSSPAGPLLPGGGGPGRFDFTFTVGDQGVGTDSLIFIDPDVAVGYDYQVNGGPNVASVLLPTGVGDDLYDLHLWNGSAFAFSQTLTGGSEFDFLAGGVDRFRILGIEEAAGLSVDDPLAFVTGLTFTGSGGVDLTMTPIPVPEPASLSVLALGALALLRRRR